MRSRATYSHSNHQLVVKLLWVTYLLPHASAFPTHFLPSSFTNVTSVTPSQAAQLANPDAPLAWNEVLYSPSVLLCQGESFTGPCYLLENNTPEVCLNLVLEVGSLRLADGADCAVYSAPACTGTPTVLHSGAPQPKALDTAQSRKVMSVFCEPSKLFSVADPDPDPTGYNVQHSTLKKRSVLENSPRAGRMAKRRLEPAAATPPRPYPEVEEADGTPSLNPWKPPPDSWPHKTEGQDCDDGPYYACMGPGHVRAVDAAEDGAGV